MKFKRIKSEKQLIAGAYIRAVINCYGKFWIEYIALSGRPFTYKSEYSTTAARQIKSTATSAKNCKSESWYLTDLSDELNDRLMGKTKPFMTVLIPFSNKAWSHLAAIKDLQKFAQATTGIIATDHEFDSAQRRWAANKEMNNFEFQYQDDVAPQIFERVKIPLSAGF